MEFEEFAKFFEQVLYAYYSKPQEEKIIIYYHVLKDYPFEVVKEAFMRIIKKSKFFPPVSEVIKEIEGNRESMAFIGYLKMVKALEDIGPYKSVVFDDKIIHAAVEALGGWVELSKTPISQKEKLKNDFMNLYLMFSDKDVKMEKVKGLTDETVYIGGKDDTRKAIAE